MLGIITSKGWEYQVTQEDLLWACRAALGEHPDDAEMVVWCMVQRLFLLRRNPKFPTLAALLLAYSQPINPGWRRDGWACRPGGKFHGTEDCSEARLARRDRYATMTLAEIDAAWPGLVARVRAVLCGTVPNPVSGAVHFALERVVLRSLKQWEDDWGVGADSRLIVAKGHNWFHAVPATVRWPYHYVEILAAPDEAAEPPAVEVGFEQEDYERLQWLLVALGADLGDFGPNQDGVDGYFGELSVRALMAYELSRGLYPDGEPDLGVLDHLWTEYSQRSGAWPEFDRSAVAARRCLVL